MQLSKILETGEKVWGIDDFELKKFELTKLDSIYFYFIELTYNIL